MSLYYSPPPFSPTVVGAANGLTLVGTNVELGGTLTHATTIAQAGFLLSFNGGDLKFGNYPNTRDDSGTFAPTSFLYTGPAGQLYEAPFSAFGISANNGLTENVPNNIQLGGTLLHDTTVETGGFDLNLIHQVSGTIVYGTQVSDDIATLGITSGGFHFYQDTVSDIVALAGAGDGTAGGLFPGTARLLSVNTSTADEANVFATYDTGTTQFIVESNAYNGTARAGLLLNSTEGHLIYTPDGVTYSAIQLTAGQVGFAPYPNTRDDTGTFTPTSIFYPGAAGELFVAPLATIIGSAGWLLTGNTLTGATPAAPNEWLGSLNDYDLIFKRNNIQCGFVRDTGTATAFGDSALLNYPLTSSGGTAFGYHALINDIANGNTAFGVNAGDIITTGTNNVFVGAGANAATNADSESVCVGAQAMVGDNAVCIGAGAAAAADNSIALGFGAVAAVGEFAIDPSIQNVNFPLTPHASGDALISDGTGLATWLPQAASSGIDTPTLTNTTNITASSVNNDTLFTRVVDPATGETIVTAQYCINVTPTAALATELRVTLPAGFDSNPSADLAGQGTFANNGIPLAVHVLPVDSQHVSITWTSVAFGASFVLSFSVMYRSN